MLLAKKVISLPEKYPAWFKHSSLSIIRTAFIFALLFSLFFCALTLPELLWDQNQNHAFYEGQIEKYKNNFAQYKDTQGEINLCARRKWFSPRMWDYRYLAYTVHVHQKYADSTDHDKRLAQWQFEQYDRNPSRFWLHYLNNPGFYWDIGLLMPLSLSTLVLAFYFLIMHLNNYRFATQEGRQPYIPEDVSYRLVSFLLEPYTLLSCILAGVAITAVNHGTGFIAASDPYQADASIGWFRLLLWISYLGGLPILAIAVCGARQIYRSELNDTSADEAPQMRSISSCLGLLKILLWITLISSVAALVFSLSHPEGYGWIEKITQIKLSPVKPIQRIVRYFFLTLGVYAATWVAFLIIGRAKVSVAASAMLKNVDVEIKERISVFNDLVENEIFVLEYFGIFLTITIMSYFQSAVFMWEDADIQTSIGLALLTGLILVALVMLIIPVIYIWYIFVDSIRFDKWVDSVISGNYLSEKEKQILIRKQKSRLPQVLLIIFKRYKFLNPILTIFTALFFGTGFTGWFSRILNWF
jgi:hypothetical protein